MNQKGFANVILVLVIVVLVSVIGYFPSVKKVNITPSLTSLKPTSGPVGTSVTITGSRFTPTNNSVKFGGGYLNELSSNGTTITFTVPDGLTPCPPDTPLCSQLYMQVRPGSYSVSVINSNGTSNTVNFTVTSDSASISPTPKPSGGTVSVKPSTGTVQPENPNETGLAPYPDLQITSLPTDSLSVKFVVEHRSALNSKSIKVRGVIVGTMLGEKACPPDRGMCAQSSIFLADTTAESRNKLYDLGVVVNEEEQEKNYPLGNTIEIQVVIDGNKVAVVARKMY